MGKHIRTLKGVRGVPPGEVARVAAAVWESETITLPEDEDSLCELFTTAHEDGLVAIALLAAAGLDSPAEALDIANDWATYLDDVTSADALGWMVIGPTALSTNQSLFDAYPALITHQKAPVRRAIVMSGMAMLPIPVEGPAAACIRARMKMKHVQWVQAPHSDAVAQIMTRFVRDSDPQVQKALRRLGRSWASVDADEADRWIQEMPGGIPKVLRADMEKGIRRTRKQRNSSP